MVSQVVGVNNSIVDELGEPLFGRDHDTVKSGKNVASGDLVQILMATDDEIYPPGSNGEPDPRNPVIATSRIGAGISPMLEKSGRFSMVLSPRPSGNTRIFVRVFNSPALNEASYYGDSQLFTVSSLSNSLFHAEITATDKPLISEDSDMDGLSDSLEMSLGSDIYSADSDFDDYSDADEYVAGTDALNEDSYPLFSSVRPEGSGFIRLEWWPSVSGRTYRIYHRASLMDGESGMILADTVVSDGEVNSVVIPGSSLPAEGTFMFRISK